MAILGMSWNITMVPQKPHIVKIAGDRMIGKNLRPYWRCEGLGFWGVGWKPDAALRDWINHRDAVSGLRFHFKNNP